ncbi:MAG TPA: winged helix-turn-helix domain-containing protein [Anaerolineae bacterium]|nr:winged helix-turn-helix domain-containing protein [Anaerolineae bacterium]
MSEKEWAETLKRLREEHKETVARSQALLKEQQAKRKAIRKALEEGPRTVPEVADLTGFASHDVMWYVMAMKKFGLIEELEMDGEYYRYQLTQEKAK